MDRTTTRSCARLTVTLAALLSFAPVLASAQSVAIEPRVGIVYSTPLIEDEVGTQGGVTVSPGIAPLFGLALSTRLNHRIVLELSGGWTPTQLEAEEDGESWEVQELSVGHGVVALRYALGARFHVRGGIGGIRYASDAVGIFREGAEVKPLFEAGAGGAWRVAGLAVNAGAFVQTHSFGTTALRREAGVDGRVNRVGATIGVVFGGQTR